MEGASGAANLTVAAARKLPASVTNAFPHLSGCTPLMLPDTLTDQMGLVHIPTLFCPVTLVPASLHDIERV